MTLKLTYRSPGTRFRNVVPLVLLSALLHACGGGGGSAQTSNADSPGGSTGTPPAASNRAPVIGGAPPLAVQAGSAFVFRPTSSDPDGDALTFSITNKPAWAAFDQNTGSLTGTPSVAGTFSGIVITVSDGKVNASLSAFAVTVNAVSAGGGGTGTARISWNPPTARSDGSSLTDLAGYRIYYGPSADDYTQSVTVSTAGVTSFTVENLPSGTYYFAITAFDSAGVESQFSTPVSKTIG
jgi:hypothetical protein